MFHGMGSQNSRAALWLLAHLRWRGSAGIRVSDYGTIALAGMIR